MKRDRCLFLDSNARVEEETPWKASEEYLLRSLLDAREKAGIPSNHEIFDEDVNIYIVGLLQNLTRPDFLQEQSRHLFLSDLDLAEEIRHSDDERHRFRLYRHNADHLLLSIGIFHSIPGIHHPFNALAHRQPEELIGRGRVYYQLASATLRRLKRHCSGPERVMEKLSMHFSDYVSILHHVRRDSFHLTRRLGEGSLYHLLQEEAAQPEPFESQAQLTDQFLDCYSAWKKNPGLDEWTALERIVKILGQRDPDFRFQMPEPPVRERPDGSDPD